MMRELFVVHSVCEALRKKHSLHNFHLIVRSDGVLVSIKKVIRGRHYKYDYTFSIVEMERSGIGIETHMKLVLRDALRTMHKEAIEREERCKSEK